VFRTSKNRPHPITPHVAMTMLALFALQAAVVLGADPTVHVAWDETPPPSLGFNYAIDTSGSATPAFPNVRLLTGSLTWRVWSKDTDNPLGVGDIGVISSPAAQNFGYGDDVNAFWNSEKSRRSVSPSLSKSAKRQPGPESFSGPPLIPGRRLERHSWKK